MTKKKTAAVVAVAFGLTATATGSYATTTSDGSADTANRTAQQSAVKVDRLKTDIAKSTDAQSERRKCVSKKKIRKLRIFMPYKRVMRMLPRATYKNQSGGLRFRSFNSCLSSISSDLDLVFKKKGKRKHRKWRLYDIGVYW